MVDRRRHIFCLAGGPPPPFRDMLVERTIGSSGQRFVWTVVSILGAVPMSDTIVETETMRAEILPGGVGLVEFSAAHEQNPFSRARMRELRHMVGTLDTDDRVGAVVLYGGPGRSFGAGGDFHEVSE